MFCENRKPSRLKLNMTLTYVSDNILGEKLNFGDRILVKRPLPPSIHRERERANCLSQSHFYTLCVCEGSHTKKLMYNL